MGVDVHQQGIFGYDVVCSFGIIAGKAVDAVGIQGAVSERPKEQRWNRCVGQPPTVGSNPTRTAGNGRVGTRATARVPTRFTFTAGHRHHG